MQTASLGDELCTDHRGHDVHLWQLDLPYLSNGTTGRTAPNIMNDERSFVLSPLSQKNFCSERLIMARVFMTRIIM